MQIDAPAPADLFAPGIAAPAALTGRYRAVRSFTESLCETLAPEDYVVQSMTDVSPTKWHLAHVSWFFETFILKPHFPNYEPLDPQYAYLFNSYYVQAGERHCRAQRGYLSRPTVHEVYNYRGYVDEHVQALLENADEAAFAELYPLFDIGLHHEQQHQELLVTDIKHVFSVNPLRPVFREARPGYEGSIAEFDWIAFDEGLYEIGQAGTGFSYDNETPRHRHYLRPLCQWPGWRCAAASCRHSAVQAAIQPHHRTRHEHR